MSDETRIHGLRDLYRNLDDPEWLEAPTGRLLDSWRFHVQRKTLGGMKRSADMGWVDTAAAKKSVTSERDKQAFPLWAKVGSNNIRVRWGDMGTGLLSEDPDSKHRRYYPGRPDADGKFQPFPALVAWATKHGLDAGAVAFSIWRRGGTKPRRFLRNAARDGNQRLPKFLRDYARDIERTADSGNG